MRRRRISVRTVLPGVTILLLGGAVLLAVVVRPWESESRDPKSVVRDSRGDALSRCERLLEGTRAQRACAREAFVLLQAAVLRRERGRGSERLFERMNKAMLLAVEPGRDPNDVLPIDPSFAVTSWQIDIAGERSVSFCSVSQLRLAGGDIISEPTGQHTFVMKLRNRSRTSCALRGYPIVEVRDQTRRIPFNINHRGDQVVTSARPTSVVVRAGHAAFVVMNNYRCDLGGVRTARDVQLRLAARGPALRIAIRPGGWIQYCGAGDPGSTLTVSPFEPSLRAALGHQ
jgi:hypothetical protein